MRIITLPVSLGYAKSLAIPADQPTVVSEEVARQLSEKYKGKGRLSGMGNYTRHYCGQEGVSVVARRGPGLGDTLVWAALCREVRARKRCRVTMAVHPRLLAILGRGEPDDPTRSWCDDCVPDAIPLAEWLKFDRHLIGEELVEADAEPAQRNIYDSHYWMAGLDPDAMPPESKRPPCAVCARHLQYACLALAEAVHGDAGGNAAIPLWRFAARVHNLRRAGRAEPAALLIAEARAAVRAALAGRPLVVWQLGASSPVRSLSPEATARALAGFRAAFPEAVVAAIGSEGQRQAYADALRGAGVEALQTDRLDAFGPVALADGVVCPDSFASHLAAGLPEPPAVVSLWASFRPDDRVKYYPRHSALYASRGCGPCRRHDGHDDRIGCPKGADGACCAALEDITGPQIAAALRALLQAPSGNAGAPTAPNPQQKGP